MRSRRGRVAGLTLVLGGALRLALFALGQAQAPAIPGQESAPLRVTTRLVQFNVVVTDGQGNPIPDLKRDDFILLDKGERQRIEVFAVETSQSTAPAGPAPPPNMFSNRLDEKGTRPGAVTAILLDGLNTRFEDQAYAKAQVVRFLQQIQPNDRVALYTLGEDLRILHDFTSDAGPLVRALERYRARQAGEVTDSEPTASDLSKSKLDEFIDQSNRALADYAMPRRVEWTLNALEAIANHLQGIPGRKNLIWVSSSFPLQIGLDQLPLNRGGDDVRKFPESDRERISFDRDVQRAVRALSDANLAVYPVDARGFVAFPSSSASNMMPRWTMDETGNPIDTMNTLAKRTGGRAFYNTNDIASAIRRAIDDSRTTYILGYYPSHGMWDGKYRPLQVRVRRRGAHVRYRQGYFAIPEPELRSIDVANLMRTAAWNPLEFTGVGLTAQATPFFSAGNMHLRIAVHVDPGDVLAQQEGGFWAGSIDFLNVQKSNTGEMVFGAVRQLAMRLDAERYEQARTQGIPLNSSIELLGRAETLVLVVRNRTSGAMGTLRIDVQKVLSAAQPPPPADNPH